MKKKITATKSRPAGKYHAGDLRQALTRAALEMVTESGLDSLSLREIARRIHVSTAAPYFHFKDRQSLLIEIAIEGYRSLLAKLQTAQESQGKAEDQLRSAAAAYLQFSRDHRGHYAVMFSGQFAGHPRFDEMVSTASQCLQLVRVTIAHVKGLDESDIARAAFCTWSLLHGIAMLNQNGILSETAGEQDALAVSGVVSLVRGI